ncbi:CLUMA_CG000751, isoform A [Clunio marinus]|uniref:CLUMA_CG000751, isoform A n=1 Tax=Clunio marinus TaxID=568069 RepID=A0A1J1HH96_9DIPT|nr:CLUMA_CG000751, isoform A [Clunio marinus]
MESRIQISLSEIDLRDRVVAIYDFCLYKKPLEGSHAASQFFNGMSTDKMKTITLSAFLFIDFTNLGDEMKRVAHLYISLEILICTMLSQE